MPVANTVYQMEQRLRSFLPVFHQSHVKNLAALVVGMVSARAVTLPKVAAWVSGGKRSLESQVERFERLLRNSKFVPLDVLKPMAGRILSWLVRRGQPLELILDRSFINDTLNLLHVAVGCAGRALPLGWVEIPHEGMSDLALQTKLLQWVGEIIPKGATVTLVADREFQSVHLAHWLATNTDWRFVLRMKKTTFAHINGDWIPAGAVALRGARTLHQNVAVSRTYAERMNLVTIWLPDQAEPWLLMTNLTDRNQVEALYQRRFWIEEMFSDHKSRGLNLEQSRITDPDRLQRLLVGVCLAYLWLMEIGFLVLETGIARWYDSRGSKRTVSVCQLGFRHFQALLSQAIEPPWFTGFHPNFLRN
jgi:hypothetical protein